MRFRSGTLERSVKRWGRSPNFSRFQRKQHSFLYITEDELAVDRTGSTTELVIVDRTDWESNTNAHAGVRNMSYDICFGLSWTPEVTTLAYDSWAFRFIMCVKDDDDASTFSDTLGSTRALNWTQIVRNTGEQPTALGVSPDSRSANWRWRGRQRFMKFDEEIRCMMTFASGVASTISDVRLSVFGRLSWESV